MLSSEAKSSIDRIWNVFWSNGMTNPLTVVEQMDTLYRAMLQEYFG